MEPDVVVRRARAGDLPALGRLAGKLVRMHHAVDALRFFLPDRVEEGYAWWLGQEVERAEVALWVAQRGAAIIGYAYGRLEERDWNQLLDACGALHDVWVEEGDRRRGVADRLVTAVLDDLTSKGAPRVVLHTASGNHAAQMLFERLGFRRTMIEMTREATKPR